MRAHVALLMLALALPLAASVAQAQQGDVKVSVDPASLSMAPGHGFYANLTISNPTTRGIALDITAHTPNSTRMVVRLQSSQVKLPAGNSTRVAAYVTIPNGTPVGDQPVVFALKENTSTMVSATPLTANVTISLRVVNGTSVPTSTAPSPALAKPAPTSPTTLALAAPSAPVPTAPAVQAAAELPAPTSAALPTAAIILAGGAVAVASGGAAVAVARKRWPWLLAPLYTRLAKARILEQPTRDKIAEVVRAEPGITFGELQRRLDLAAGSLTHHARKLEDAGVLFSSPDGQTRRFFHVGAGRVEPVPPLRERALSMLSERPLTLSDLADALGVSKQSLHYHVKKLEEEGRVTASPKGELVVV